MRIATVTQAAFAVGALMSIGAVAFSGEPVVVVVRTEIKAKTLPFQAGVKSVQTLTIDLEERTVHSDFRTGTTDIGVADLNSVRDKFAVTDVTSSGDIVEFRAIGETASGVMIMPNINYDLRFKLDRNTRKAILAMTSRSVKRRSIHLSRRTY